MQYHDIWCLLDTPYIPKYSTPYTSAWCIMVLRTPHVLYTIGYMVLSWIPLPYDSVCCCTSGIVDVYGIGVPSLLI